MSEKRLTGMTNCRCNKCGAEAMSIAGKDHRRCGGSQGAPLKKKHEKLPKESRGEWTSA